MEFNYSIEIIPAAAIGEAIAGTPALIVDTTTNDDMAKLLGALYSVSNKKIYYTRPGINGLSRTLALAEENGIRCIVLGGKKAPDFSTALPAASYSASLIAPGNSSADTAKLLKSIISDNNVTEFSHIAYQTYRYEASVLKELKERQFEELRLGELRKDIALTEPLLRNKEYIFMDLRSVRYSDFPDNETHSPNGLYAEEICQIARYAGMGQRVKRLYIFGYPSKCKAESPSSQLAAEILWHMTEALATNKHEDPGALGKDEHFLRKIVSMGEHGQDIVFVTSSSTGRWWMEVPEIKINKNQYIPCSYSDYLAACSGDVPIRWLFFFQKINPN
ncbi:MAG: hypothetical protein Q7262_01090 [Bacteroidales bacterium]|nr:hypothetical protein [Bacteroidales bacterium]